MLTKEEKRICKIWQYFDKYGRFPEEESKEIEEIKKDFDSLFAFVYDAIPQ